MKCCPQAEETIVGNVHDLLRLYGQTLPEAAEVYGNYQKYEGPFNC